MRPRVGLASIKQETNTFAPRLTGLDDFLRQGWWEGQDVLERLVGTNSELAGAAAAAADVGAEPVPLLRAYALAAGRVNEETFAKLRQALVAAVRRAGPLAALFLSLHGAMAAEGEDDADAALAELAGQLLPDALIGISLDFHANVTARLMAAADFIFGFHTYPHVDQSATGARAARFLVAALQNEHEPVSRLAKRALILPAETTQTIDGPMSRIRRAADRHTHGRVIDVSIFVTQPWLDVADLGIGVVVTTDGDEHSASLLAEEMVGGLWKNRRHFAVDLVQPAAAVQRARESHSKPVLLIESADSPTAGAAGDSPAMLDCLLRHAPDLRAFLAIVDGPAVAECTRAGVGSLVRLRVGSTIDRRYHRPVEVCGEVVRLGTTSVALSGPVATGMRVPMGYWAVVRSGRVEVLLTQEPAHTYDPATFRTVGLRPEEADVIVVRSANAFRAGYRDISSQAIVLDLPGASSPRLETLTYSNTPPPLTPMS